MTRARSGLLHTWLGHDEAQRFLREDLGRRPFARPQVIGARELSCDWTLLDRALQSQDADTIAVANGEIVSIGAPTSYAALRALFGTGIGVALRQADRAHPVIAELCARLGADIAGRQRAIVFATAAQTHGFGWHFDAEDVFIAQTVGKKTYYLRSNTVSARPLRPSSPAFAAFVHETSPLLACELHAGDCLYIPRGYWHVAFAQTDSLSLSLGVITASRAAERSADAPQLAAQHVALHAHDLRGCPRAQADDAGE